MKIYLCGINAVGKTSTAQALAKYLNYDFIDPDDIYINKFGKDIPILIKNKRSDMIYKRMSWCLRQVKGNNVVVPVNLYSSSFDKTNQKQKDTQYCKKNGIIVLILPSEKIGESAQILWNRLKERDYYNPKYYTYMESFDKLKESIKYMLEISDIWVFDNNSPESASKKIIILLNKKGYLKN